MRKLLLLLVLLFVIGCLPATQSEVLDLTETVKQIVPAVREEVAKASIGIEDVLVKVESVNEDIATAEDPIDAIEMGWNASAPFNPYYGYGAAVLAILRILQVGKQKKETEIALEEVVTGVERGKRDGCDLKAKLKEAESVATMDKVSKIRNRLV